MQTNERIPAVPFVFLRHGQSEGNDRSLCQGQIDFALTPQGIQQAKNASNALKGQAFNRVVSSPLRRALHTAQTVASLLGIADVRQHRGLVERGWGILEGQPNEAMYAREALEETADLSRLPKVEGLEDISTFRTRIADTMADILHEPGFALIVGHGRFFSELTEILGYPPVRQVANAIPMLRSVDTLDWIALSPR